MNKLKFVFLSTLGLLDVFVLSITIGYLAMGLSMPNSLADRTMLFTGCYILCLAYFLVFALITALFLIFLFKWKRKKDNI